MVTLTINKAKEDLTEILKRVIIKGERIAVQTRDKKKAILVSAQDVELLEKLEDLMDLDEARKALKEMDKAKDWKEFEKELGL